MRLPKRFFSVEDILDIAQWAYQGKSSHWIARQFDPPRAPAVIWACAKKHKILLRAGRGGAPKGHRNQTLFTEVTARAAIAHRWELHDLNKKGYVRAISVPAKDQTAPAAPPAPRRYYSMLSGWTERLGIGQQDTTRQKS